MKAEQYTMDKLNLPDFMQDFHDQKDLFKAIHQLYSKGENKPPVDWVSAQIYTIDFFLWFMGQHGYKLQKDRSKKVAFYDIHKTIKELNAERTKQMSQLLQQAIEQKGETNE